MPLLDFIGVSAQATSRRETEIVALFRFATATSIASSAFRSTTAIAVEKGPHRNGLPFARNKTRPAAAQQDRQAVAVPVRDRDVQFAIAIQIGERHRARSARRRIGI